METPLAPQPSDDLDRPHNPHRPAAGQPHDLQVVDVGRWIYTNNPFYAISAFLVLWGLRSSFDTQARVFHTFALMAGLVAYTLLLALAAYVVIRFGKVWEDGRTMLLLIVLMFLAISVSFDDALAIDRVRGTICYLGGLLLSVLVTEGLLRGLRLRMPALFRVPYYLILALFFLYPIGLRWTLYSGSVSQMRWAVLAFPALAGLVYLSLLPAVWRGRRYLRRNGSPWPWPWYPWTLFFMIGLGVCGRAYYLCVSMHLIGGTATIFAPYFLVPFLLAANLLLLEIGVVSRSAATLRTAMAVPAGLLLLAMIPPAGKLGHDFLHETFMGATGASPLFVTTLGMMGFYAWALVRRVPSAVEAVWAALLMLSVVGPSTVDVQTLIVPRPMPILLAGALQGWMAVRRRSALRCLVATGCAILALTLDLRETAFLAYRGMIPAHLMLAAMLLIGAVFRDPFARWLERMGAAIILAAAAVSLTCDLQVLGEVPPLWLTLYPAMLIPVAAVYGRLVRNWLYYGAAAGAALCWLAVLSVQGYRLLRQAMAGADYILWGLASLVLAVLISLTKTGHARAWIAGRRKPNAWCGTRRTTGA